MNMIYFLCTVQTAPPLIARYVPFAAVAAANCVNIPMMRQQELINGIVIYDDKGNEVGKSRVSLNSVLKPKPIFMFSC